ncbi:MAG TPA: hypothetical protein VGR20_04725 [Acidimicrobiia bacterium]|nr:hypothetical protein [Acidimicrobiia bacterium]
MPAGSMHEPQPLEVYLNDHLGGATGACEVTRNAVEKFATSSHRNFLSEFLTEVEEDRATLEEMIRAVGGQPNPMKQAGAWLMEKVSRIKLSPGGTGSEEMSALLTLEMLCIGVEGKICLWAALQQIRGDVEELSAFDLDDLMARAQSQRQGLEKERLTAARPALMPTVGANR